MRHRFVPIVRFGPPTMAALAVRDSVRIGVVKPDLIGWPCG